MVGQQKYPESDSLLHIKNTMFLPAHGIRLIQKAVVEDLIAANDNLNEANNYVIEMSKEADKLYKDRYQVGYKEGREEGGLEHSLKVFSTIFSSIKFISKIKKTLVHVVIEALHKIIGETNNTKDIETWVQEGLSELIKKHYVRLVVSGKDEKSLQEVIDTLKVTYPEPMSLLYVVPDKEIKVGSCRLESELGVVETSLKTQIKALEQSLGTSLNITQQPKIGVE